MAERLRKPRAIELEYHYDRLFAAKLEQVYQLLVPNKTWSRDAQAPSSRPYKQDTVTVAIYARVSSERQKEDHTIRSQVAALIAYANERAWTVPAEWVFEDEGYRGASLVRPGLERLRDRASEGLIERVLVYSPDRLSRKYAYQVLLIEEPARHGVDIEFIKSRPLKISYCCSFKE